jgi:hypothetical protein
MPLKFEPRRDEFLREDDLKSHGQLCNLESELLKIKFATNNAQFQEACYNITEKTYGDRGEFYGTPHLRTKDKTTYVYLPINGPP